MKVSIINRRKLASPETEVVHHEDLMALAR
jgi:hypothetical protein